MNQNNVDVEDNVNVDAESVEVESNESAKPEQNKLSESDEEKVKMFTKYAFVALTGNNPGDDFTAETMIELQTSVDQIIGEEKTKEILYHLMDVSRDSLLMAYIGMWPPSSTKIFNLLINFITNF